MPCHAYAMRCYVYVCVYAMLCYAHVYATLCYAMLFRARGLRRDDHTDAAPRAACHLTRTSLLPLLVLLLLLLLL